MNRDCVVAMSVVGAEECLISEVFCALGDLLAVAWTQMHLLSVKHGVTLLESGEPSVAW
jgi:hypothetical protein